MTTNKIILLSALFSLSLGLISCATTKQEPEQKEPSHLIEQPQLPKLSRNLTDKGQLTAVQLTSFFMSQRPDADINEILNFALDYIIEANAEGINSDVAFAQMCLETGYLRFGGLVQRDFNNFCGLGAMDKDHPGEKFPTRTMGIRAHIQHLQAYATTEDTKLKNELIDPRYNWVHKTKFTEDIFGLAGTWATDKEYGNKINNILSRMETK